MPVYLFSFHAYRSWMPDHRRGYTKRGEGYLSTDHDMAQNYERRAKGDPSRFNRDVQRSLVERVKAACAHLNSRLHACATEEGHLHALVSWRHARSWLSMRTSLKTSLTRHLHESHPGIDLSRGASRKRVRNRKHFDYLMQTYLPDHPGWGWYEDRGWIPPRK